MSLTCPPVVVYSLGLLLDCLFMGALVFCVENESSKVDMIKENLLVEDIRPLILDLSFLVLMWSLNFRKIISIKVGFD
jgi:hypothetical protein